jgi:hypothetical protein
MFSLAVNSRGAGSRRRERRHHANQRRFARAVRSEQTKDLLLGHLKAHVVDSDEIAELFSEVLDFDGIHGFVR